MQTNRFLGAMAVICALFGIGSIAEAQTYSATYTSTSGDVQIVIGKWTGLSCASTACTWTPATVTVGSGYADAKIVLTAFDAAYDDNVYTVRKFRARVKTLAYDVDGSGKLDWEAGGELSADASSTNAWGMDIWFAIVLTRGSNVKATNGSMSCTSTTGGSCSGSATVTGAVPSGTGYCGAGFYDFAVAITEGTNGIAVKDIGVEVSGTWSGTSVNASLTGYLADGSATEDMTSNASFTLLSASSSEAFCAVGPISRGGSGLTTNVDAADSIGIGGTSTGGFLALTAWRLTFASSAYPVWWWNSGFKNLATVSGTTITFDKIAELANTFGSATTASYTYLFKGTPYAEK